MRKTFLGLSVLFFSMTSSAQLLAKKCSEEIVVHATDSVFDMNHAAIAERVWTNPGEIADNGIDDDQNGYIDDLHGWNNADNTNKMGYDFDLGLCDAHCKRFLIYRFKKRSLKANPAEIAWSEKAMKDDPTLLDRASHFINVFHGTSTISVAIENTECVRWVGNRDMTDASIPFVAEVQAKEGFQAPRPTEAQIAEVSEGVVVRYLNRFVAPKDHIQTAKARVSGHAYYFSDESFAARLDYDLKKQYKYEMSEIELNTKGLAIYQEFKKRARALVLENPNTLFVFPTNNAAENVDQFDYFPMNLQYPNTIVVQASDGLTSLAPFTGYGVQKTDIAVPSVGVYFAVPGGDWLWGSATSLSVPVMMNTAARMLEINPKLTAIELKQMILKTALVSPAFVNANKNSSVLDTPAALKAAEQSLGH